MGVGSYFRATRWAGLEKLLLAWKRRIIFIARNFKKTDKLSYLYGYFFEFWLIYDIVSIKEWKILFEIVSSNKIWDQFSLQPGKIFLEKLSPYYFSPKQKFRNETVAVLEWLIHQSLMFSSKPSVGVPFKSMILEKCLTESFNWYQRMIKYFWGR